MADKPLPDLLQIATELEYCAFYAAHHQGFVNPATLNELAQHIRAIEKQPKRVRRSKVSQELESVQPIKPWHEPQIIEPSVIEADT